MKNSNLFVFPTDTVWGIGAPVFDQDGANCIHQIKKSNSSKAMAMVFPSVSDLLEYFPFFGEKKELWKSFFKKEVSLLIPKIENKGKLLPEEIKRMSPYVGIRVLEYPHLREIYQKSFGPFFATSLNLSGEKAIVDYFEAKKFHLNYCPGAIWYEQDGLKQKLSGTASTLIKTDTLEFLRKGRFTSDLLDDLKILL